MKKIIKITLGVLFLFSLTIACKNKDTNTMVLEEVVEPAKTVFAENVEVVNQQKTITANGTLISKKEEKLSFRGSGQLFRTFVKGGDRVVKGQKLAVMIAEKIDVTVLDTDLGSKDDLPTKDEADIPESTNEEGDNPKSEGEEGDNPAVTRDESENPATPRNGIPVPRKNGNAVKMDKAYVVIKAPADGIIIEKYIEENNAEIEDGMPIFLFVNHETPKVLEVVVDKTEATHVQIGDKVIVFFDDNDEKENIGEIISVSEKIEVIVEGAEDIPEDTPARVTITTQSDRPLMSVPLEAIVSKDGNTAKVFTLEDGDIISKDIVIFEWQKDKVLVQSGLDQGDQVVMTGDEYIQDDKTIIHK